MPAITVAMVRTMMGHKTASRSDAGDRLRLWWIRLIVANVNGIVSRGRSNLSGVGRFVDVWFPLPDGG